MLRKHFQVLIWLLIFISQGIFAQQKSNTVVLKGIAKNFNNQIQIADFSKFANFLLPDIEKSFIPDKDGQFSVSFKIDKPDYFTFGRNKLFLSPGDNLFVEIDYDYAEKAIFKGKGAEANIYLKNTPFPKAGSFLKAGEEIKNNFDNTLNNILSIARSREKELVSYKNLTSRFVQYEKGRIKADIINSLFALRYYYTDVIKKDSIALFKDDYFKKGVPLMEEYAAGFYSPDLLDLEVYRDILHVINKSSSKISNEINSKSIEQWIDANKLASKLKNTSNKDSLKSLQPTIEKISDVDYRKLLNNLYDYRIVFGNGDTAKNFTALNENDLSVSLEKFKGSVIYLDIWATWCGPCLSEMPYFDSLKMKYKDTDIVFISLSIDSKIKEWKDFLISKNATGNQWNINRLVLEDYAVDAVPRYIIINKEFKIVDMYGPKPSSKKTDEILKKLIE
jgi:thiol-disulfide isomerase/thioredoxin